EPIASTSIFPYINQLVRELDITGGDDAAVGYYAGLIESLFFVTQALTVLKWSRLSDRIGRKPVLLIGISGSCFSILAFGLSTTFWSLVISRCVSGALNGNTGVVKTMVGEFTDPTNIAQAFAWIPISYSIGSFFGPLMGGTLARPQDQWPTLFAHSFWNKYPYFLPCAGAACLLVLAAFTIIFFLEETLSTKRRPKLTSAMLGVSFDPDGDDQEALAQKSMANVPLRSLLIPTIALLPLFYSTPIYLGGLGFTPASIGWWLAMFGIADGTFEALFFAKIVDRLGPKRLFCVSVSCFVPLMTMFPIMSWLVQSRGMVDHTITIALLIQLVLFVTWSMAYGAVFLIITNSAPSKNVLGAINGLGQMSASTARAVGPALATSLFAFSKEHNVLNGNAVFVVFIVLTGGLRWLGSQLPDKIQDRDE
ncbi:MFS general substrate transporter, partial [Rhizopogon salebrosus TDB-379]